MNAERLNAICQEIKEEINSLDIIGRIQAIANSLQAVINNPPHPSYQEQLTTNLQQIYEVLSDSPSDRFSPAWRQALDETGISEYLGEKLSVTIHNIFERNQITPATALNEIQQILTNLQVYKKAIDNIVSSFETMNIGAEELNPGESEIGFLIPRRAVENNLNLFGKELQELNFILGVFAEISTGKRDGFEIKTISSTDLSIYLKAIPPIAACVAHAAEKIVTLYKTLLEIRKLKAELIKSGVPEDKTTGITSHADSVMSSGIQEIKKEIMEQYYVIKDDPRKNEIENALVISLNKIANRIDLGFNIEVRAQALDAKEELSTKDIKLKAHIEKIQQVSRELQFIHLEGERLLYLPEEDRGSKK